MRDHEEVLKWYYRRRMRRFLQPFFLTGTLIAFAVVAQTTILLFSPSLLWAYVVGYGIVLAVGVSISTIWKAALRSRPDAGRIVEKWGVYGLMLYGALLCLRAYVVFRNYGQFIDLSYYESAVSQLAAGMFPKIWDIGSPVISQHFEPILLLFVPWYWLGLGGSALLVWAQAILAVSGGYFLYRIALLRRVHKGIAVGIVALYLMAGGLQSAYLYGFHPIALFPFFFLWSVYWYERKQFRWYVTLLLASLFIKEEISFVVLFWGLWIFFGRKDRVGGLVAMALGAVWYFLSFGLIALVRHGGYEYWGQFGGGSERGVFGIIHFALTHPIAFVSQFFDDARKLPMVIELFASFGLLPFFAPMSLLMLVPSLLLKLLSHDISMMNSFHYSAAITPLLALSALEGLLVLRKRVQAEQLGVLCIAVAVLANIYYGFAFYYRTYAFTFGSVGIADFLQTEHSRAVDRLLAKIPADASVSCEYAICSHISRPYGKKLPIPHTTVLDYVLLDPTNPSVLIDEATYRQFVETNILPHYDVIDKQDGAILFIKRR